MRQNRFEKAKQLGLIPEGAQLSENIPNAPKWDDLSEKRTKTVRHKHGGHCRYDRSHGLPHRKVYRIPDSEGNDGEYHFYCHL